MWKTKTLLLKHHTTQTVNHIAAFNRVSCSCDRVLTEPEMRGVRHYCNIVKSTNSLAFRDITFWVTFCCCLGALSKHKDHENLEICKLTDRLHCLTSQAKGKDRVKDGVVRSRRVYKYKELCFWRFFPFLWSGERRKSMLSIPVKWIFWSAF